jgi:hypothetical protein
VPMTWRSTYVRPHRRGTAAEEPADRDRHPRTAGVVALRRASATPEPLHAWTTAQCVYQRLGTGRQGLPLIHFPAETEPCLSLKTTHYTQ